MTKEEFTERYLTKLNEQQREAVETVDGATLLLAVPGSGKTSVLVTRLGYMVHCCGIAPSQILTMTYTVAATAEMKQRFASMFGDAYTGRMEFRTINGLSHKIIEYYSRHHSRREPFSLLENEGELAHLIGQIYQNVSHDYPTESTIKDIRTAITYIKNMMLSDEELETLDTDIKELPTIYKEYCAALKCRRLMDYDDQMAYALQILRSYPAVLNYFQDKFRYLCVDEAQDTSRIQHAIIALLAQKYGNIFMVGDEDQSIYGFRAAYPEALLHFEHDYANAKVLLIEQNYRSTRQIVSAADQFVQRNRYRHPKTVLPARGDGKQIRFIDVASRAAQYYYLYAVAQNCEEETAVLYRNNDSALPLIDMLEREGIAYHCRQFDGAFFTHRVVADIADIVRFAYDPNDAEAFMRIYYKLAAYIPKTTAEYVCTRPDGDRNILERLLATQQISTGCRERVTELLTLLPDLPHKDAKTALQLIWNTVGYRQYAEQNQLDAGKFTTLMLLSENEATLGELMHRLDELREITRTHHNQSTCRFLLSTIHSSKGLEYERVYLLDAFDGILPSVTPQNDEKLYEEERRVFYVGMTRAKDELYLFRSRFDESCFVNEVSSEVPQERVEKDSVIDHIKVPLLLKRYTHRERGNGSVVAQDDTAVLIEYESGERQLLSYSELLAQRKIVYAEMQKPQAKYANMPKPTAHTGLSAAARSAMDEFHPGDGVEHIKFGHGVIIKIDRSVATIRFGKAYGDKNFDLLLCIRNGIIRRESE